MVTALVSLLTDRPVRPVVGMTGEEDSSGLLNQNKIPELRALRLHGGTVYRWNQRGHAPSFDQWLAYASFLLVAAAGPLVVDEVPYRRPTVTANLQAALKELTGSVCVPFLVGHDLVGVAVLGAFANRRAYTSEDVEVLREVSVPCAVALAKARLLADYRYRAEQLALEKRNLEASIVELTTAAARGGTPPRTRALGRARRERRRRC